MKEQSKSNNRRWRDTIFLLQIFAAGFNLIFMTPIKMSADTVHFCNLTDDALKRPKGLAKHDNLIL